MKETALIVAVETLPEDDGLDQVFRIDKLANEVDFIVRSQEVCDLGNT